MLTTTVLFFAPTAACCKYGFGHCSTTGLMLFLTVLPHLSGIAPNPAPEKRPYQISSSGPSRYRAPLLLAMSIPARVLGAQCVKQARAALLRPWEGGKEGRRERERLPDGRGQPAISALTSENPLQVALKVQSPLVEGAGGHGHCPAHGGPAAFPLLPGRCQAGAAGPSSGRSSRSLLPALRPAPAAAPAASALQESTPSRPGIHPRCGSHGGVGCCTPSRGFRSFLSPEP